MHLVLKAGTILDGLQPVNFRQRKQQQGWLTGIRLCIIMCVHSHFLSLQVHASVSIVPFKSALRSARSETPGGSDVL